MTTETNEQPGAWTWADQVSSWRFWGLLISYLLAVSLGNAALNMALPFLRKAAGISTAQYGSMVSVRVIATGFGFCLAWIAIKWRPVVSLMFLAVLKVCGLILLFHGATPLWARFAGWVLVGLSTGAISLAVPAIIAGGRCGAEAFLVAFGVVTTFGVIVGSVASYGVGACIDAWGMGCIVYVAVAPVVVGALILLTVRAELFTGQPPDRGYALTPLKREPITVALLFFVPFYGLYWLYRAHGEVSAVAPSRTLLSPRGALLGAIFVPFLSLVAMASLIDALNRKRQERGRPRLRSPVEIFLWAFFFTPVAGALIQSGINELLTEQPEQPAQ